MKSIAEFFPKWTEMVGWTLLNSTWQAFAIFVLLNLLLRLIPSKFSQLRYVTSGMAMGLILALNIATFIYLMDTNITSPIGVKIHYEQLPTHFLSQHTDSFSIEQMFKNVRDFLATHMPLIFLVWLTGAMLFALRLVSGWWYISTLRSEAVAVPEIWFEKLQHLAGSLGINRIVALAQSARIHSPIVIGFLKPIVLVPASMLGGLSTEQVEAILIHELAHIRRHDYIINLIQSFIEALFFFNPFVWTISNVIRREREFCCDDTVIKKHGGALAYAHALAQMEEVRLSKSLFALSLAENKNQLLNRIKRIMEKSAKNYSGRDKMIPAALLVIGLICASWLSVNTGKPISETEPQQTAIASDTTKKNKKKTAHSSETTIITIDENGKARETAITDSDKELTDITSEIGTDIEEPVPAIQPVPAIAPVPVIDMMLLPMPSLRELNAILSFDKIEVHIDSVPFSKFSYRSENWDEFSKAFEEKFREQFTDFYKTHGEDFDKMMKELEEQFATNFDERNWAGFQNLSDDKRGKAMDALRMGSQEDMIEAEEKAREAVEEMRKWEQEHKNDLQTIERDMMERSEDLKKMEEDLKLMEKNMKAFEKELTENLITDGYILKADEVKTINWDDNGTIEINGKKINAADRKKYIDLHRKFFEKNGNFRYVE